VADNLGHDARMLQGKFEGMAESAFEFARATASLYHRWAALQEMPNSPLAWSNGDLHVENFGCYRGETGLIYFDINDFDHATLLPACVDLVRFLSSILIAGRAVGLSAAAAERAVAASLTSCGQALKRGKPFWMERSLAEGPIHDLIRATRHRKRKHLLDKYTDKEGGRRHLEPHAKNEDLLPLSPDDDRDSIAAALKTLQVRTADKPGFFDLRDVKIRVAGKGSRGLKRYVALVTGDGDPDKNSLIDIKIARPSRAFVPGHVVAPLFASDAERIVFAQDMLQAVPPRRLAAVTIGSHTFTARELQPVEDRLDLHALARETTFDDAVVAMASIAAFAWLRGAGRRGADAVEAWQGFGERLTDNRPLRDRLIDLAGDAQADNRAAYRLFCAAFAAGEPRLKALFAA
jgi:uncharacterized protein (DUF2252 family)